MKRLSLTARLSLMFMLAVTGVLAAAGYFFSQLSEHHFDELDRHTLHEKLEASRRLLGELDDLQNFERVRPQLQALLGGHRPVRRRQRQFCSAGNLTGPDGQRRAAPKRHRHLPWRPPPCPIRRLPHRFLPPAPHGPCCWRWWRALR